MNEIVKRCNGCRYLSITGKGRYKCASSKRQTLPYSATVIISGKCRRPGTTNYPTSLGNEHATPA